MQTSIAAQSQECAFSCVCGYEIKRVILGPDR